MASHVEGLRRIKGPDCWQEAQSHMMQRDRILRRIIPQYDDERIEAPNTPFLTLVRSIIGQQVSRQSALAIWGRFLARFDDTPMPKDVLASSFDDLRSLGLSRRKTAHIQWVAAYFAAAEGYNLNCATLENERIPQPTCNLP